MTPSEIFLVAMPSSTLGVARQAAQLAFPESPIGLIDDWAAAGPSAQTTGGQLLVLANPDAAAVAGATQAVDRHGLPRWAVVVLGGPASDLAETVPPEEWNPPLLARVFRSALLQHELLCENLRLRGDLKTVARRIAHDLRSPLGCIHTTSDLLKELDAASLDGMAVVFKQSSLEISQIIDRVSFVLKASAEPSSSAPVEMGPLVDAVLCQLDADLRKTGTVVMPPRTWPEVAGVAPWLQVIWWNLLHNTLQHGGPAAQVRITWEREPGACRFSVADQGAGVPLPQQDRLFAPFDQLHGIRIPGLGLSIVQRLTALQGGRCGYDSPPEGGACFYFTLPSPAASG